MLGWIGRLFVPARREPCEECERLKAEIHRLRGVVDRQVKELFRVENCIRHLQVDLYCEHAVGRRLAEQLGREKARRDVLLRPGRN